MIQYKAMLPLAHLMDKQIQELEQVQPKLNFNNHYLITTERLHLIISL